MRLLVAGLKNWNPWALTQQLVSIVLATSLIATVTFLYKQATKKQVAGQAPTGLALIGERVVLWAEGMMTDLLGVKYKKLSVFFLYLLFYLGTNNLLSIIGFESAVTSFTVPLSLGLICFFGIYYFGLRYHRLSFFKKYLINPAEVVGQFVPLISISFRLFGNILGGSILTYLFVKFSFWIWGRIPVPYLVDINLLAGLCLPIFDVYFDLFDGLIQAYIFALLMFAYWSVEIGSRKDQMRAERISSEDVVAPAAVKSKIARLTKL